MLLVLSSVNAKGKTTELGTATFRLEKILATKQDVKAQQLPFYGKDKGVAATAKVSVTALAALQSLEGDAQKAMAHGANAAAAEKGSALAVHVLALSHCRAMTPLHCIAFLLGVRVQWHLYCIAFLLGVRVQWHYRIALYSF